ncbi:rom-1 [Symbiodinium natans]|uniref:Rom-1 protein n=1 Tax=Symbiodinium natans TaxID=878477 RepID=A0A812UTG3_9DINO|nr:rom-1 [Symbiodinium natans]
MESNGTGSAGVGNRPRMDRSVTSQMASDTLLFAAHWFGARRFDQPKEKYRDPTASTGSQALPSGATLNRGMTSRMVPESLREEVMANFVTTSRPMKSRTFSKGFSRVLSRGFTKSMPSQPFPGDRQGTSAELGDGTGGGVGPSLSPVHEAGIHFESEDDIRASSKATTQIFPSELDKSDMPQEDGVLGGIMMARQVSGSVAVETLLWQYRPIFTFLQLTLAVGAWALLPVVNPDNPLHARAGGAGLESVWPGETGFMLQRDCVDLRYQGWRWLTYQFSHASLMHILGNSVMLIIVAIPLEGFHGHVRLAILLNVGVAFGAAFDAILQSSTQLVGMSAGVYALMGMHYADVIMNWGQMEFRYGKTALLLFLIFIDSTVSFVNELGGAGTNISHGSHFGGWLSGLLMGILVGRNLKMHNFEYIFEAVAAVCLLGMLIFAIVWLQNWPPRSVFEAEEDAWCWVRQVYNNSLFRSYKWQCVFCSSESCVKSWATQKHIETVAVSACAAG